MVGFGTSLRMARRTGWERAYLDYETLKMLLSQIEAVYEEEGHRQRTDPLAGDDDLEKKDYRDELFVESDSDLAFASSDDEEQMRLLQSSDDERRPSLKGAPLQPAKPFSLTYSHEASSSDADSIDLDDNCGGGRLASLGWTTSAAAEAAEKKRQRAVMRAIITSPSKEESEYFVGSNRYAETPSNFIMQSPDGGTAQAGVTSLLQRTFSNENTALLHQQHGQGSQNSGMFYPSTPPRDFYDSNSQNWALLTETMQTKPKAPQQPQLQQTNRPPTKEEIVQENLKEERRRQRKKRRLKLAQKQRARDLRVPRHLRVAHAKARAITERFLGLLRAEVEKVTLFAQSRLGELADTAGSLRFPSYDDSEYGGSISSAIMRHNPRTASFENPLSDGGMHPSASSSDDEDAGRRGQGSFPWSDSSDGESDSQDGSRMGNRSPSFVSSMQKSNSGGAISVATEHLSNVSMMNMNSGKKAKNTLHRSKSYEIAQRQISHFADIRVSRPLFQRIDHIVGEDLLLLSAVDEADGYTAVGVELMHVLRFISVNVIAVRKICRKHDRLLMNRMLGGYYHRKWQKSQNKEVNDVEKGETPNTFTLGGIVSRSLGDSNARQVFVTGINQNKLTGLYDAKIQQLANSNTVQVISSSIALALSEYEVTQSRADALAKLNSASAMKKTPKRTGGRSVYDSFLAFGLSPSRWVKPTKTLDEFKPSPVYEAEYSDDSRGDDGPPSTASTVSLTRLRFTVVSIFALREVARRKQDNYKAFISRSSLVFTGANVIGEGLDGCSREILDFFVAYSPDAALLLASSGLYIGLQKGEWKEKPIGSVMLSTLAMGVVPSVGYDFPAKSEDVVAAVSVMPISGDLTYLDGKHKMKKQLFMSNIPDLLGQGVNPATLRLNSMGMFLYSMNYYIAHSTATAFVQEVGAHPAHSASIIGAASFGALVAALFQLRGMSLEIGVSGRCGLTIGFFRRSFLIYGSLPIIGNVLHAIAVSKGSIPLAVFGRFLIGFGSAEILHRQLLSSCLPAPHVVFESANLVHSHVFGVFCGLITGGFLALFDVHVKKTTISSLHSGSYFMAGCWLLHWVNVFRSFQESTQAELNDANTNAGEQTDSVNTNNFSAADSSADGVGTPESVFFGSGSISTGEDVTSTYVDELEAAYGSPRTSLSKKVDDAESLRSRSSVQLGAVKKKKRKGRTLKHFGARLRKVLFHNVGIPVTLAVIVFVRICHEIIFSSCAIITNRYFQWNGSQACFLLGLLSATVLPINYVVERISRSYDERSVIKRSIVITMVGLFTMVNYVSIINLMIHLRSIFDRTADKEYHPYDWIFGAAQYLCGLSFTFAGTTSLEPTTLSLMSKLAPSRTRSIVINSGTIVTVLGLAARSIGDLHILMVGLSHRLINTDIVNSLVVPLVVGCLAAGYVTRRHFFFLI